ncbi:Rid family hydrolase, partial [Salmonella enterica subsp. enterica serovar Montevideo]|nr:Rid family hydrolase [Salmonella enterica subsp. enterica serovar Montevideo]
KTIATENAPAAIGPYVQGVDLGSMVITSGQIPVDPKTGAVAEGPGILSIPPRYWQVYGMAMVIAIVIPVILTTFIYQRKHRQGTL